MQEIGTYQEVWVDGEIAVADRGASPTHIRFVCGELSSAFSGDSDFSEISVIYGGSAGPGLLSQILPDVDGMFLGRLATPPTPSGESWTGREAVVRD